jgi:hypothetical protein
MSNLKNFVTPRLGSLGWSVRSNTLAEMVIGKGRLSVFTNVDEGGYEVAWVEDREVVEIGRIDWFPSDKLTALLRDAARKAVWNEVSVAEALLDVWEPLELGKRLE